MEDQIILGNEISVTSPAAMGVWEGSSGSDKSSGGSNAIPVEIRPDEDETFPVPETTEAETEAVTEATHGEEEMVVVSILGEEEATEAVETTQATEPPVAADLPGQAGGSGTWIIAAAVLVAALVVGILLGRKKRK